jgi:undecaprenyl diphosphate synthase
MIYPSISQFATAGFAKDTAVVSEDAVAVSLLPAKATITNSRVPRHLALVLDASPATTTTGSLEALQDTLDVCRDAEVRWLSVLLPVAHNGNSGAAGEVQRTVRQYVQSEAAALAAAGVRIAPCHIPGLNGNGHAAHEGTNGAEPARSLYRALSAAARLSVPVESLRVQFGLGCGGREGLLEATRRLAVDAAAGRLSASEITPLLLERQLAAPPVDLLIRTGGSQQISDFLMWQAAYAELLFVDVPWTRFRSAHLRAAFSDYAHRDRKFGALPVS